MEAKTRALRLAAAMQSIIAGILQKAS